ncbi:hypothetical protein [Hymenobacter volaticus]|uniref:Uncharacterized protein n=1 Tax=Hymenobacter volaticus TaxID=2932254 RepID=A0ABY4GDN9_9BACT|nr:hypothetical protein [Hymenobacter volaticus]UOQ68866.1 hypothetical protein MUN86_24465 [Hymenobacter volaticus]
MDPTASGLRRLFDLVQDSGGHWSGDTLHLPTSIGTGFMRLLSPEPGLKLAIHSFILTEALTLDREADYTQPETLLVAFHAFDPAPQAALHLSTARITSSTLGLTTQLPAQTAIFIVALAIDKTLLSNWLPDAEKLLPALFTNQHPVVLDTLLTPEIQAVLRQVAVSRPAHPLDNFFYKIKMQELLYWLFWELALRAMTPVRLLHPADAEKIYQVRTALLANLSDPPNLPSLAEVVG